jgi:hypothetical protein
MNLKTQLRKAYAKRINSLNKSFFKDPNSGLKLFVEQLKFKRDILITQSNTCPQLASLTTAIAEFEAFQTSEEKKQKEFHWNNFCDFVKLNQEEWQVLNDSI